MPAQSNTTVKIKHDGPRGTNDLHLQFDQDVDVKGVNGVPPDDPNADYTIENDGKGGVDISDMDFEPSGETKLRLKGTKKGKPKLAPGKNFWTINGEKVGKDF